MCEINEAYIQTHTVLDLQCFHRVLVYRASLSHVVVLTERLLHEIVGIITSLVTSLPLIKIPLFFLVNHKSIWPQGHQSN